MALRDYGDSFRQLATMPTYASRKQDAEIKKSLDNMKLEEAAFKRRKQLFDMQEKLIEMEKFEATQKAASQLEVFDEVRGSIAAFEKTGDKRFLVDSMSKVKADPELAELVGGIIQGDGGALAKFDVMYESAARKAGVDVPKPEWKQYYDENKGGLVWINANNAPELEGKLAGKPESVDAPKWKPSDFHWAELVDGTAAKVAPDDPRVKPGGWMGKSAAELLDGGVEYNSPEYTEALKEKTLGPLRDKKDKRSEEDRKVEEDAQRAAAQTKRLQAQASRVVGTIEDAQKILEDESFVSGFWGPILSKAGGTDARTLAGKLSTIMANEAFTTLQEIREASKTGGGLGAISERELDLLANVKAALDQGLPAEELNKNLDTLLGVYKKLAGMAETPVVNNAQEYNKLPSGTVYIGPDGKERVKK